MRLDLPLFGLPSEGLGEDSDAATGARTGVFRTRLVTQAWLRPSTTPSEILWSNCQLLWIVPAWSGGFLRRGFS
jgi:hypothetical protein